MGTFYGGVAHVPLSALVLVCELAGSYDLLVPMMLSIAVAFVTLRRWSLYDAQPATKRDSQVHAEGWNAGLASRRAADVMIAAEVAPLASSSSVAAASRDALSARRQLVVPALGGDGHPSGLVELDQLRETAAEPHLGWVVVADVMLPWCSVHPATSLDTVAALLVGRGLRQVPVVRDREVVGYVGEAELARALLRGTDVGR
jgi:CIC family chloride channel protein